MYIVLYFLPQCDGDPNFKIKFFATQSEAEQFAEHLENHTFFTVHGVYEANKIR